VITVVGCWRFENPRRRADIQKYLGTCSIVIDTPETRAKKIEQLASYYNIEARLLFDKLKTHPLLCKFFLLLWLRKFLYLDYCVYVDDDIVFLDEINNLAQLANDKIPFVFSEPYKCDQEPEVDLFFMSRICPITRWYVGLNTGMFGVGLRMFDIISTLDLKVLLDFPLKYQDQSIIMSFIQYTRFGYTKIVGSFYSWHSFKHGPVYHAICTEGKLCVDLLRWIRGKQTKISKLRWIFFWFLCNTVLMPSYLFDKLCRIGVSPEIEKKHLEYWEAHNKQLAEWNKISLFEKK